MRPHWRGVMEALGALSSGQRLEKRDSIVAQMADDDELLTFPERKAATAPSRLLDPLPLILPEAEWAQIAAGLEQRAQLLDSILADVYGPIRSASPSLSPRSTERSGTPPTTSPFDRDCAAERRP